MEHLTYTDTGAPKLPEIRQISHPLATIWLAREKHEEATYFYGGTRLIEHSTTDSAAVSPASLWDERPFCGSAVDG